MQTRGQGAGRPSLPPLSQQPRACTIEYRESATVSFSGSLLYMSPMPDLVAVGGRVIKCPPPAARDQRYIRS